MNEGKRGQRCCVTSVPAQRPVVDYQIAYVKQSGAITPKVFKLKKLTLAPGQRIVFGHRQSIRDFTTRTHYVGGHELELIVNGNTVAQAFFDLVR